MRMISMATGLRYALGGLLRRPLASATAVLTLALALAASAVLLLALHALYLAPLPYANGERMVHVYGDMERIGVPVADMSWALTRQLEAQPSVALAAGYRTTRLAVRLGEYPESVSGVRVEAALFDIVGAEAVGVGRGFDAAQVDADEAVVVLAHGAAQAWFGGAEAALGKDVAIDGRGHRVVGVLRPDAGFPDDQVRLLAPLRRPADDGGGIGQLGEIATVLLATGPDVVESILPGQMAAVLDRMEAESGEFKAMREITGLHLRFERWREHRAGDVGATLGLLAVALAGLLLLAGSNVSNVLMERFAARRNELSVRMALGATRARLARLVLADAALLSFAGWLLGLALSVAMIAAQQRWQLLGSSPGLLLAFAPAPILASLGLTIALSLLTALFPIWMTSRLRAAGGGLSQRGGSDGSALRARRLLVTAQTAISLALLVVALLLGRSLAALWQVDPGFAREGVITAELAPGDREPPQRLALANELLDGAAGLVGVESVGLSEMLPFGSGYMMSSYEVDGRTDAENPPVAFSSAVSSGYFRSMEMPVLRGRGFLANEDRELERPVVVIDQRLADLHFPEADPVGHRLRIGPGDWMEIVGVVGVVRQKDLADDGERGQLYLPMAWVAPGNIHLVLRTHLPAAAVLPGLRALVQGIDPGLPLRRVETMQRRLDESLRGRSGPIGIVAFFAAVALLLAGIGLYGLLATAVIERRAEIGVRMALGADGGRIVATILRDGLRLVGIGLLVGALLAALLLPLLRHHLYGIAAADPYSFALAAGLLLAIALVAIAIPAWRAAHVAPSVALRGD